MKPELQEYIPNKPGFVFSSDGYQRLKMDQNMSFYSSVLKDISPLELYSPDSVDVSWSTNNVYVVNYKDKMVYKLNSDGVKQKYIQMDNPTILSIVQGDKRQVQSATAIELGVWVLDGSKLMYINPEMEYILHADGFKNVIAITSSNDNGCYVADDDYQMIIMVNSSGEHVAFAEYTSFLATSQEKIIAMKTDYNGYLWILGDVRLYKIKFEPDGSTTVHLNINLKSIVGEQYTHSCIDIERWAQNYIANESSSSISDSLDLEQHIYTASGNENDTVICKFYSDSTLVQKKVYSGYKFPLTMKVGQARYSNSIMTLQSEYIEYIPPTQQSDEQSDEKSDAESQISESSRSSESSSSIYPGNIYLTSSVSNRLWRIDTNTLTKSYTTNIPFNSPVWNTPPSYGPSSSVFNSSKNGTYLISPEQQGIYFNSMSLNTTTYVNAEFNGVAIYDNVPPSVYSGTEKTSLCVSNDSGFLWVLAGNMMNIGTINHSLNTVDFYPSTYYFIDNMSRSIGNCTGISNHPTNGKTYLSTRDAIWFASTDKIFIGGEKNILCTKLVNKPSGTQNGIQDILLRKDGSMLILDSYLQYSAPTSYWLITPLNNNFSNLMLPLPADKTENNIGKVYIHFQKTVDYIIGVGAAYKYAMHIYKTLPANGLLYSLLQRVLSTDTRQYITVALTSHVDGVMGGQVRLSLRQLISNGWYTASIQPSVKGHTNIFEVSYDNPSISYKGVAGWDAPVELNGEDSTGVFECFSSGDIA